MSGLAVLCVLLAGCGDPQSEDPAEQASADAVGGADTAEQVADQVAVGDAGGAADGGLDVESSAPDSETVSAADAPTLADADDVIGSQDVIGQDAALDSFSDSVAQPDAGGQPDMVASLDAGAGSCDPECPGVAAGPCQSAICVSGQPKCKTVPKPPGTPCDDGNPCTVNDVCKAGKCAAGKTKGCDDHNPCTLDTCNKANGACGHSVAKGGCKAIPVHVALPIDKSDSHWSAWPTADKVRWQADNTPSSPGHRSGGASLNFNDGKDFADGSKRTRGVVYGKFLVDATKVKGQKLTLRLFSWAEVEKKKGLDRRRVELSTNGFASVAKAFELDNTKGQKTWQKLRLNISSLAGETFQLRFSFDSVDGNANSGRGWFIDDVEIYAGSEVSAIPTKDIDPDPKVSKDIIYRPAGQPFTLAILPDTQIYTYWSAKKGFVDKLPQFSAQTSFLRKMYNHPDNNLIFAAHLGDLVDNPIASQQWQRARTAMKSLDAFTYKDAGGKTLHHFIPNDIAWGDHDLISYSDLKPGWPKKIRPKHGDYISGSKSESTTHGFGVGRYKAAHTVTVGKTKHEWWKTFFRSYAYRSATKSQRYGRNSYHFFDAGGNPYVIFFLEFCPNKKVIDWVKQRLTWYKSRRAIIVTHMFINTYGTFADTKHVVYNKKDYGNKDVCFEFPGGYNTSKLWKSLVVPHNVHFVLCGHANTSIWQGTTYRRTRVSKSQNGLADRDVHIVLTNFQSKSRFDGGRGYLRMMRFRPDADRMDFTVWSPYASQKKLKWNDPKYWPGGYKNADRYCNKYTSSGGCASKANFVKKTGLCASFYGTYDKPGKVQSLVKSPTVSLWCNDFSIRYPMKGQW